MQINNMTIDIKIGDITKEQVDVIVNAANNTLLGGGGVDGAIHKNGGPSILKQCIVHSGCPTGEARITTAGNLPSKYIIHTVGPIYGENMDMQEKFLYKAYYNSLIVASEYNLKSISFPSISTGAYNYPIEEAVVIVYNAIKDFSLIKSSITNISLIHYNEVNFIVYKEYFLKIWNFSKY